MEITNGQIKFIDELMFKMPELKSISSGDKTLTPEDGTALYRLRRFEESARISTGIQEVLETLEEDKKVFLSNYYWGADKKTVDAAGRETHISEKTAKRWKKEIAAAIAKRLGWL